MGSRENSPGSVWARIRAWHQVRPGYWFAPKLYGYGATPVRWQGWAMVAGFVVLSGAVTLLGAQDNPVMFALLGPLVFSFVLLCRAKTDGGWRWRWGVGEGS